MASRVRTSVRAVEASVSASSMLWSSNFKHMISPCVKRRARGVVADIVIVLHTAKTIETSTATNGRFVAAVTNLREPYELIITLVTIVVSALLSTVVLELRLGVEEITTAAPAERGHSC